MILGIDLGSSNTLASTLSRDGSPVLIPDYNIRDQYSTPSLVFIENKSVLAGALADSWMDLYPNKVFIKYYKRAFGTNDPIFFDDNGNPWHSESVAALMLRKIRYDAEMFTSDQVSSTVITIPAHFNHLQRRSVINAARLADIKLSSIIEEPVAAAISYGHKMKDDEIIMVYDLGGGTFDLTIILKKGNQFNVLAKDGLTSLGGKEFDEVIAKKIMEDYHTAFNKELYVDHVVSNKLRKTSELLKIILSSSEKNILSKWMIFGQDAFEFILTKDEFIRRSETLVEKTERSVQKCLKAIGLPFEAISKIILVGGSSQFPYIRKYWSNKIDPNKQEVLVFDPLQSVAKGAALYAGSISDNSLNGRPTFELNSVSSYSIAVKTHNVNDGYDILINKNSPLPISAKRVFTLNPNQVIEIDLVQIWDLEEKYFDLGTIGITPSDDLTSSKNLELQLMNKEDGTIGVKVTDVELNKPFKFDFNTKAAKNGFDFDSQSALVNSVVINNTI